MRQHASLGKEFGARPPRKEILSHAIQELNESFAFVRALHSNGQENERNDKTFTTAAFYRSDGRNLMIAHFICLPACLVESLMLRYRTAVSTYVSNDGKMRRNG